MTDIKRVLKCVFGALGVGLVAAVLAVLAIVAAPPEEVRRANAYAVAEFEQLPAIPATDATQMPLLTRVFGHRLYFVNGMGLSGTVRNDSFEGKMARVATIHFGEATLYAVRPAIAAPLILQAGLDLSLNDNLVVAGLPAMYAQSGDARCLYFSDDAAAYAFYAPQMAQTQFFDMAQLLMGSD